MEKITTIEDLATLIQRTMASKEDLAALHTEMATKDDLKELATKAELTELRTEMRQGFQSVNARLDTIRLDISDLPVLRETVHELTERVARLEERAGLKV